MNDSTNSVAGSLARHTMTAGGAATLVSSQNEIIQAISLLITLLGLIWSIVEKFKRQPPPPSSSSSSSSSNLVLALCLIPLLSFTACRSLAPGGPYQGDAYLYHAELTITTSYDVIKTFVKWEQANREVLAKWPEVRTVADALRKDAPDWFRTAHALRDAYASDPTDPNRTNLEAILALLRSAISEAGFWMSKTTR